ncbi:penicillin-binding protein [Myxococcus xanthus]|nr:penicillin-binding protein [Myxococcus xanthus]
MDSAPPAGRIQPSLTPLEPPVAMRFHRRLLSAAALLPLVLVIGATEPEQPASAGASEDGGGGVAAPDTAPQAAQADAGTSGAATASQGAQPDSGTSGSAAVSAAAVLGGESPDGGLAALAAEPGMVPPVPVPSREKAPPIATVKSLPRSADLMARAALEGGKLVVKEKGGKKKQLTIDPVLQASLTQILRNYETPYGAAVVLEPSTGRVLALAEHSAARPELRGLPVRAVFPAASIFKVITGGALLEAGVTPDTEECFHGGKRRISEKHLQDSERDSSCYSLALAMGKSANVIFAKLTNKHLTVDSLRRMAARFRFNREIEFPVPTDVSLAAIPEETFSLANTGAGFGDVYLSPLHGALVAAVAANEGRWVDPILFEPEGPAPLLPVEGEPVLTPEVAKDLTAMLEETVTSGTARAVFRERGFRVDDAVGKTGSLADREPFRDYSWFVGFAPKDNPRVAVAAIIVNDPKWRIRGTWLGREALRLGLERMPAPVEMTAPASAAGKH